MNEFFTSIEHTITYNFDEKQAKEKRENAIAKYKAEKAKGEKIWYYHNLAFVFALVSLISIGICAWLRIMHDTEHIALDIAMISSIIVVVVSFVGYAHTAEAGLRISSLREHDFYDNSVHFLEFIQENKKINDMRVSVEDDEAVLTIFYGDGSVEKSIELDGFAIERREHFIDMVLDINNSVCIVPLRDRCFDDRY